MRPDIIAGIQGGPAKYLKLLKSWGVATSTDFAGMGRMVLSYPRCNEVEEGPEGKAQASPGS